MEPAADALRREMLEEAALAVSVSRLLWIVENFFTYGGEKVHELLLCFEMTVPASVDLQAEFRGTERFRGTEGATELTFRWLSLDRLHTVRIEPAFLVRRCAIFRSQLCTLFSAAKAGLKTRLYESYDAGSLNAISSPL